MKTYNTMLTKDYVPDWSIANGIREFVANWLDSDGASEFEHSGNWLELTNKNIKLDPSCLTLGTSGNRSKKDAVGTHGEGILIGLIPLLREGLTIELRNSDVLWTPKFKYNEDFDKEILVIEETPYDNGYDYSVFISGLNSYDIDEVIDNCLYLQKDLGEVLTGSTGRVLKDRKGKLFVGGMFVTNLPQHQYVYDFYPQYLALNRDRLSVDSWDLASNTCKLLEEVFPSKELVEMVKSDRMDTGRFYARLKSEEVFEEAYVDFKEKHGDNAIVASDDDSKKELEKKGYTNVKVVYNEQYRTLIKNSESYNEFIESIEETLEEVEEEKSPIEMLEDWAEEQSGVNDPWDSFETLLDLFKSKGVQWR